MAPKQLKPQPRAHLERRAEVRQAEGGGGGGDEGLEAVQQKEATVEVVLLEGYLHTQPAWHQPQTSTNDDRQVCKGYTE